MHVDTDGQTVQAAPVTRNDHMTIQRRHGLDFVKG